MRQWRQDWWARIRMLGRVPLLLRGIVLASSAVAVVATAGPSWDVPDGYVVIAGVAAMVAAIAPDSGAGAYFAAAIVVAWATGADAAAIGPAVVVTALALLVGHVAAALAAAMSPTASADLALVLRWWRPTAVLAAGTVATAVLLAALDARSIPGSIVVVLVALAVSGLGIWWWSAGNEA